jgi:hypothetical protein
MFARQAASLVTVTLHGSVRQGRRHSGAACDSDELSTQQPGEAKYERCLIERRLRRGDELRRRLGGVMWTVDIAQNAAWYRPGPSGTWQCWHPSQAMGLMNHDDGEYRRVDVG